MHASVFQRKHLSLGVFKKLRCSKSARRCHFKFKIPKNTVSDHFFEVCMWFCKAGAIDSAPCQSDANAKVLQHLQKNNGRIWQAQAPEEDLRRWVSRGRRRRRDITIRLGGQGADFLERWHFGAPDLQSQNDFA